MKICSKFNLTWAGVLFERSQFFSVDQDGYANGLVASYLIDSLLLENMSEIKKKKLCRFIWHDRLGSRLENGTYDGSIGAIINSKADIHYRPMDFYVQSSQIDFSSVVSVDRYVAGHLINWQKAQSNSSSFEKLFDILIPSTSFFNLLFFSNLFYLLSVISIFLISKKFTKIFINSNRKRSIFRTLSIAYVLFNFVITQFMANNINTKQVIVDVSDLIYSKETLMNTKRRACYIENSKELEYFTNAPENTLPNYVYNELTDKKNTCFMIDGGKFINFNPTQFKIIQEVFLITPDYVGSEGAKELLNLFELNIFAGANPLFENLRTFYLAQKLSKVVKNFIDQHVHSLVSGGFIIKAIRDVPDFLKAKRGNFKLYTKLSDYIDDYTTIKNVSFIEISYLFKIYFTFLLLILACFLLDFFVLRVLIKRYQRLKISEQNEL